MDGIEIRSLRGQESPSGLTYEWCKGLPGNQVTLCTRKAGTVSGNHYHTGSDPSKNPERFILLEGEAILIACDGLMISEKLLTPFTEAIIYPFVLHALRARTKIIFAEYRATVYDPNLSDTFFLFSFPERMAQQNKEVSADALASYATRVGAFE